MNIILIASTVITNHTMRASGRPRTWIYRISPQTDAESQSTTFLVSNKKKNGAGQGFKGAFNC